MYVGVLVLVVRRKSYQISANIRKKYYNYIKCSMQMFSLRIFYYKLLPTCYTHIHVMFVCEIPVVTLFCNSNALLF